MNLSEANSSLSTTESDPFLMRNTKWSWIPGGPAGTLITLEAMANLARKGLNDAYPFAIACIENVDALTIRKVDGFLRSSFVYREEENEVLRGVDWLVAHGFEGDCDDMAIMGASMTKSIGFPSRFTAIKPYNPDEFEHVFCEARIGTDWVPIDPTVPYGTVYQHYGMVHEYV